MQCWLHRPSTITHHSSVNQEATLRIFWLKPFICFNSAHDRIQESNQFVVRAWILFCLWSRQTWYFCFVFTSSFICFCQSCISKIDSRMYLWTRKVFWSLRMWSDQALGLVTLNVMVLLACLHISWPQQAGLAGFYKSGQASKDFEVALDGILAILKMLRLCSISHVAHWTIHVTILWTLSGLQVFSSHLLVSAQLWLTYKIKSTG